MLVNAESSDFLHIDSVDRAKVVSRFSVVAQAQKSGKVRIGRENDFCVGATRLNSPSSKSVDH